MTLHLNTTAQVPGTYTSQSHFTAHAVQASSWNDNSCTAFRVRSVSCRDGDHSPSAPVPGCLDRLHSQPSSNHLDECSWRWTSMQPRPCFSEQRIANPELRVTSSPRQSPSLVGTFPPLSIQMSPPRRYTEREMDRVRSASTHTYWCAHCVINRLVQMSDKASSAGMESQSPTCAANRAWGCGF